MRHAMLALAGALSIGNSGSANAVLVTLSGANNSNSVLARFSPDGYVGTTDVMSALALAVDATGTYYTTINANQLGIVSPQTGKANAIAPAIIPASGQVFGLEISATGQLFGTSTTGEFFSIDRLTGAAVLVGATGVANINDLAFDANNALFGVSGNALYSISTSTGAATLLAQITGLRGNDNLWGLSFNDAGQLVAITTTPNPNMYFLDAETGAAT